MLVTNSTSTEKYLEAGDAMISHTCKPLRAMTRKLSEEESSGILEIDYNPDEGRGAWVAQNEGFDYGYAPIVFCPYCGEKLARPSKQEIEDEE